MEEIIFESLEKNPGKYNKSIMKYLKGKDCSFYNNI